MRWRRSDGTTRPHPADHHAHSKTGQPVYHDEGDWDCIHLPLHGQGWLGPGAGTYVQGGHRDHHGGLDHTHDAQEKGAPTMDINTAVIAGRLATPPERTDLLDTGSTVYRLLVTTRSEHPKRRTDVLPITIWNPDDTTRQALDNAPAGTAVSAQGSIQRRFYEGASGRRSRLEIVADSLIIRSAEEAASETL